MNNRRDFIKTALGGAAAAGLSRIRAAEAEPDAGPQRVDRRPPGKIGIPVSILGLGLGSAYTRSHRDDPETARALLETALDHGVNYWDTCRGYGPSEDMIGPVVEKRREEIFLVTKSGARDYDGFMRDVETSLNKLRTDRLELLHLWNLGRNEDLDRMENGCFKAAEKLKDEKVIGHFGITGHSGAAVLMAAIRRFDPDALLSVYPCTRDDNGRYEDELLPLARERNMGVIAMKCVRKARNADLKGSDLIRYSLTLDGVHSAIVGLDTEAHLMENLKMATDFKPLGPGEMAGLHLDASRALADMPTPWEQPGYRDGALG